jgi:nicotinate-nucleotide adenylyltransferase
MKLGLYGGSFDPVHLGHLLVARAALEELELARLVFLPAARSPFKPGVDLAPAGMRLRLLRLALAGEPRYAVDEQELHRGGISYAVDTVRDYAARFPTARLFFLIGADHVAQLSKWRDAAALAALAEFVVIPRPGVVAPPPAPGLRCHQLAGFPVGLSASQVRARVKAGQPVDTLVPAAVAEAIRNNRLYL